MAPPSFRPQSLETLCTLLAQLPDPFLAELHHLLRQRLAQAAPPHPDGLAPSPADAAFLRCVHEVVTTHLANTNFGVEWLADELALCPRQLQRRLRALTKLSAAAFIRTRRLERAAQLLSGQAGAVAEVAQAVGFRDVKHFSCLFKAAYGTTPFRYARQYGRQASNV